ncbi:spindle pole body protein Sad1 [Schizosaccharomyces octosporus yFS286]|uniref:Spindle pole body protein Sad1 n=1 Tax=Schizosaccharomyces octosporus (strain yFS286) TaxID=483514 RepID=S9R834_SCHOY|nr:spindle pole body protein Sad1 [Schizosaccharomyces octosporus yFS286]EPX74395.1 spindle pole body protein Sad1 [Schizosaccharomyces octosporus yFS286]
MFTNTPVGGKRERYNGAHPAWSRLGTNTEQIHQNTTDMAAKMHKLRYTQLRSPPTRVSVETMSSNQTAPAPAFGLDVPYNQEYINEASENEEFERAIRSDPSTASNASYSSEENEDGIEDTSIADTEDNEEVSDLDEDSYKAYSKRPSANRRKKQIKHFFNQSSWLPFESYKPFAWFFLALFLTLIIIGILHKAPGISFGKDDSIYPPIVQPSPPSPTDLGKPFETFEPAKEPAKEKPKNENEPESSTHFLTKEEFHNIIHTKINELKTQLEKEILSFKSSELAAITLNDEWKHFIQTTVENYIGDPVSLPNFALLSTGADVLSFLTTKSYVKRPSSFLPKAASYLFDSLTIRGHEPNMALQSTNGVAMCWSFQGSEGQLGISLSRPVHVTNVTVEHVNQKVAHDLSSAPKEIEVWGQDIRHNGKKGFSYLGNLMYNIEDEPIQTFPIHVSSKYPTKSVIFKIKSNWGNPEYTCLYQVRVHGTVPRRETMANLQHDEISHSEEGVSHQESLS